MGHEAKMGQFEDLMGQLDAQLGQFEAQMCQLVLTQGIAGPMGHLASHAFPFES